MEIDLAVKRSLQRCANAARQVDIGREHDEPVIRFGDGDDAVERVLTRFGRFLVAHQADDLGPVLPGKAAMQGHRPRRRSVLDPPARRTDNFAGFVRLPSPLPATVPVDGAALRTNRRLRQLLLRLEWIEDAALLGPPGNAPAGPDGGAGLRHGCLLGSPNPPRRRPGGRVRCGRTASYAGVVAGGLMSIKPLRRR